MKTTNQDFIEALDKNPIDFELRNIYADFLEENGDKEFSDTQRWLVENKVAPLFVDKNHPYNRSFYGWNWAPNYTYNNDWKYCCLPKYYDAIYLEKPFITRNDAEIAFMKVLADARTS